MRVFALLVYYPEVRLEWEIISVSLLLPHQTWGLGSVHETASEQGGSWMASCWRTPPRLQSGLDPLGRVLLPRSSSHPWSVWSLAQLPVLPQNVCVLSLHHTCCWYIMARQTLSVPACHLDVSARVDTVVCHKLWPLWGEDQVWENLIEQLFKAFNRESAVVTGPRGRGGGGLCPSSPQAPSSSARMLPGRFTSPGTLGPWVFDFSSSPSLIQGTWDLITHPVQGSETFLFRFPRGREVSQAFLLQKLVSGKGLPGRSSGPAPWAAPSAPRDCQRLVGTWHFWGIPLPARNLQWCKVMPQMPKPAVETWLCWYLFCF